MSMLTSQCEKLRDRADELRMLASGMDAPYIVPSTKLTMAYAMSSAAAEMREAADTIESLSAKLASCWDTCHVVSSRWDEMMGERCVELSCGHSVWGRDAEPPNYCPDCGKKVEQ